MDVKPPDISPEPLATPPPDAEPEHKEEPPKDDKKKDDKPKTVQSKQPKQPHSGVGAAIFATVVIVLALAAMATYAFIKTR